MNTTFRRVWAAAAAVVVGLLVQTGAAWAQVKSLEPATPRISDENASSSFVPWAIAFCFALGILLVAFKNSRRTHLD